MRAIADMEYRIQAAMRHQGLARKDAIAYVHRVDKERRQWTRSAFDVEWDDPTLSDVIVNLSRMTVETACELVVRLTERKEFQPCKTSGLPSDTFARGAAAPRDKPQTRRRRTPAASPSRAWGDRDTGSGRRPVRRADAVPAARGHKPGAAGRRGTVRG